MRTYSKKPVQDRKIAKCLLVARPETEDQVWMGNTNGGSTQGQMQAII